MCSMSTSIPESGWEGTDGGIYLCHCCVRRFGSHLREHAALPPIGLAACLDQQPGYAHGGRHSRDHCAGRDLRAASDVARSNVPRSGRAALRPIDRLHLRHGRSRTGHFRARDLRRAHVARDRDQRDSRLRADGLDPRPALRLLLASGFVDHASDGRVDGLPEHPAGDRDHGQPRPIGASTSSSRWRSSIPRPSPGWCVRRRWSRSNRRTWSRPARSG